MDWMDAPSFVAYESKREVEQLERFLKTDFDRIFNEEFGFSCAKMVSDVTLSENE